MTEEIPKIESEFEVTFNKLFSKEKGRDLEGFKAVEDFFKNNYAELCVFFHKGQIYTQFFWTGPLTLSDRFTDFHYQNQTDPPDDIAYEEYEQRRIIWDEILERSGGIPAYCGLVYDCANREKLWNIFFDIFK